MHPLEAEMAACLEAGEEPEPNRFGGIDALAAVAEVLTASPLMPEFMRIALPLVTDSGASQIAGEFVCKLLEGGTASDIAWTEAVDVLDEAAPLPAATENRLFARFLAAAADRSLPALARAAGLDGAIRWANRDRGRQLRLSAALLDVSTDDNPDFLARAAKVMGVAYSHWREPALLEVLAGLRDTEGAADEAAFELGMARLADGLDADDPKAVDDAFAEARSWFEQAAALREVRPDARLYAGCLEVLASFSDGSSLAGLATEIARESFGFLAWPGSEGYPPWLGARRAEAASWTTLALKLKGLAEHLDSSSWWEPVAVIEEHLLSAYCAGRAILRRSRDGGIEAVVRPRIESSLARERYQGHLLKQWLSRNADGEWRTEAEALVARIDALISEGHAGPPREAAASRPTVAALVDAAALPESVKMAIADVVRVQAGNLTASEVAVLDACIDAASAFPDYRDNAAGRMLFNAALMWTVRFLAGRLDLTKRDVPAVEYLFERADGSLPHENALQQDYFNVMHSNLPGTEIEVSNVGGGRADLRFSYRPERLVAEIKRETDDGSFEALLRSYAAQTTDYQNISVRLGFLLVLDLTELRSQGTPHLRDLVRPCSVIRTGESEARLVVVVKMPGRRLRPSDLSKVASANQAASKEAGKCARNARALNTNGSRMNVFTTPPVLPVACPRSTRRRRHGRCRRPVCRGGGQGTDATEPG